MKLLHLDSSINGAQSLSRALTRSIVDRFHAEIPSLDVTYRDLAASPVPHVSGRPGPSAVLDEFVAADIVVIGAPMYNFSIPSQLKTWIDAIAVAGVTFSYSDKGPQGLCGTKRVIVASARGGIYPADEHQESYLRMLFGFLGVKNMEFIRAEGIAYGPEYREKAMIDAGAQVQSLNLAAGGA